MWRATRGGFLPHEGRGISIHALRVEGDAYALEHVRGYLEFQSTPSVWRATSAPVTSPGRTQYFNPRPPCGGRRTSRTKREAALAFQSTPSVWRATYFIFIPTTNGSISIHALRVEGDVSFDAITHCAKAISIHALRVEGDSVRSITSAGSPLFQSTPSVWRATDEGNPDTLSDEISIHALRVEGD